MTSNSNRIERFSFRWKAKVKKVEKDVDRHKFGSNQMLERNEQLVKELENSRNQNAKFREEMNKIEFELNESKVRFSSIESNNFETTLFSFRLTINDSTNISDATKARFDR